MTLEDDAHDELRELEAVHQLRLPRVLDGAQGALVTIDGVAVVNFASNDYLGLANDPRIRRAMSSSLDDDGAGVGASRLIVGNHRRHVALEAAVGDWLQRDGVRLFNSGYAANVGVLSTLARAGDVVFSDELNHASIIDGCRLSRAEIVVYPHRDLAALERSLAGCPTRPRRIVVSESLFSMDGALADVTALSALCRRHDAALVLDEAHALGVMGIEGRGVAALAGIVPDVVVGTFGKALGTFGGFAAASRAVTDLLWNRARSLVFSTGMPPSVAAATTTAIDIVRGSDGEVRRQRVIDHARRLRSRVPTLGGQVDSPIAPLLVGDNRRVMQLMARLLDAGVFVQGIRPPTVPPGTARLRISLSAANTVQQLETLATTLDNAVRHND